MKQLLKNLLIILLYITTGTLAFIGCYYGTYHILTYSYGISMGLGVFITCLFLLGLLFILFSIIYWIFDNF